MVRAVVVYIVGGFMACLTYAQVSQPMFDVASVKHAGTARPTGGSRSPGQWRAERATLVRLIRYGYPRYEFEDLIIGGPDWVRETRFDVEARMAPSTSPEQLAQMVVHLLAERFQLRTHAERRPIDIYALRMARADGQLETGLKRSNAACVDARKSGQPLPPECRENAAIGGMQYRAMQISDFIRMLSALGIDRPVVDRTGLSGYFDLQLHYDFAPFAAAAGRPIAPPVDGVSFFTALQEQAGLKLEPVRELVDVLVIDSAQSPTPN